MVLISQPDPALLGKKCHCGELATGWTSDKSGPWNAPLQRFPVCDEHDPFANLTVIKHADLDALKDKVDELTSVLRTLTARIRAYDASPVKVVFEDPADEGWYALMWDGLLDAEWAINAIGEDGFIGDYEESIEKETKLGEAFVRTRKEIRGRDA